MLGGSAECPICITDHFPSLHEEAKRPRLFQTDCFLTKKQDAAHPYNHQFSELHAQPSFHVRKRDTKAKEKEIVHNLTPLVSCIPVGYHIGLHVTARRTTRTHAHGVMIGKRGKGKGKELHSSRAHKSEVKTTA